MFFKFLIILLFIIIKVTHGFLFLHNNLLNSMNKYVEEVKKINSNYTNYYYGGYTFSDEQEYDKFNELDYTYRDVLQPCK